jgi:hypothetical protein
MQQPESATFREGVVNSMRATQGAETDESPEADHPAYKYQVSSLHRARVLSSSHACACRVAA